jgi:thiosulfate/3-mercaptopyruvate sulfurtransferase
LRRLFSDAGFKDGRDLVTYCTVGLRAAHLYFIARYLGWRPRLYDGSMSEWSRRSELPMVTGTNPH